MTKSRNVRPSHQANMLSWLQANPEGARLGKLAEIVGRHGKSSTVSGGAHRLCELGLIGYVERTEARSGGGGGTYRQYFAREHCPPGAVLAATVRPLTRGRPKQARTLAEIPAKANYATIKRPQQPTPAEQFAAAPPRITERTKVTICPAGKDHRFTPATVQPFFTARQDRRLEPRPWVYAITGGAR